MNYQTAPTDGGRFGAIHTAYIVFFLAATVGYALFYRGRDARARQTADRVLGTLVFFLGLCEYGITALLGRFDRYSLPIHLCSLMFTLTLLHAWTNAARPGSFAAKLHAFLGAVLFHPGLPGTWAALLFPDWLDVPFRNYLSITGFLVHGFVSVYAASVLVGIAEAADGKALLRRDLKNSLLFMGVGAAVMALFDRASGTNYWFMAGPSAGSPFSAVYAHSGYGGYLLAFSLTTLLVTALCYALRYRFLVRGGSGRRPRKRG